MAAPTPSKLDMAQCIQGSYDEAKGALRVEAELTASIIAPPGLEVAISAVDDNIAIRNSNNSNELLINPDGSINVTSSGGSSDTNLIKIAGTAVSVGNGTSDAGTLRVAIASNNSPLAITGSIAFISPQHFILDSGTLTTITNVVHIDDNGGSITVDGPLTDTQLRASAVPISAASLPLPTGAATSALQTTGNSSLSSIDGKLNSLGQKTMAGSVPVVIASDQSSIPVTATVSGSVSVSNFPSTVDTNYGTVGANTLRSAAQIGNATGAAAFNAGTTTAQTLRVVLPTDQTAIPATQSGTWNINNISGTISLPTGAATAANQATANASLASIDTKLTSPIAVSQSGTWTTGRTWTLSSGTDSISAAISNFPATVAVTQSTSPWVVSGTVTANAGTGTFAVSGPLTDAQLRATPVPVSGTFFQVTQPVSGTVAVSNFPTTVDTNYGTVGANTLRSAAQIGNATGAALFGAGTTTAQVLRVVLPTDQTSIPVTATLSAETTKVIGTVNQGTSPWIVSGSVSVITANDTNYGTVGANTLRTAAQIGNATGAALFGAGTTTAQVLRVVLPTDQTAIPASQSGSWSVTANAGTNLNTSALALESSLVKLPLTQGSTTSGQSGVLTQGAVTTAAPSYTTGQTSPLSLTTSGALRVDNSANVQPISGSITATQPVDIAPATQTITVQDTGSTTTAMANGQNYITGTATANSTASFAIASVESVEVMVTGTWTGTLSSEISLDGGTTWFTRGVKQAGAAYISTTFTTNFAGGLNAAGMTNYRVRATAAMTGTATVKIIESLNASSITVSNALTLRDSTTQSIQNTIKAASTQAATTDTSVVIAISPNSPLADAWSAIVSGAKSSISTSAVQITATSNTCRRGVVVKAADGNTGIVYVGPSTITNGTTDATDGIELSAGQAVVVDIDNTNKVYVIGSASGQKVYWIAD